VGHFLHPQHLQQERVTLLNIFMIIYVNAFVPAKLFISEGQRIVFFISGIQESLS
jgi:hypothetical protein